MFHVLAPGKSVLFPYLATDILNLHTNNIRFDGVVALVFNHYVTVYYDSLMTLRSVTSLYVNTIHNITSRLQIYN